jgi:hypothetical protein
MNSAFAVAKDCGITYRQMDHWVRLGYLQPGEGHGSGHARQWTRTELGVARDMGLLVKAGLLPAAAHRAARGGRTRAVLSALNGGA